MSDKFYNCKYKLVPECGEFQKEDIDTELHGLTDAFLFVSILRQGEHAHDGSKSTMFISFDGQNDGNPIPDTEMFQVWTMMAHALRDMKGCADWQREIASQLFESARKIIVQ